MPEHETALLQVWEEVTALLGSALAIERARIGDVQAAEVQECLDHNELALAHDQLIDALGNHELMPLGETRRLLGRAGRLMDHRRTAGEKEIEKLEARLREAILVGDIGALDRLISPFAIYTDQAGRRITKSADLAAYRSGLKIEGLQLADEMIIWCFGDTAIVSLVADVSGSMAEQAFSVRLAYTRVWHRSDGNWQVEAAHSSVVLDATG